MNNVNLEQKINLLVEVDICPLIIDPNICTFISTNNLYILNSIKYGMNNLYSEQQFINYNFYQKDINNEKKEYDNVEENSIKHYILIRFFL
jgi:hypothetical protein